MFKQLSNDDTTKHDKLFNSASGGFTKKAFDKEVEHCENREKEINSRKKNARKKHPSINEVRKHLKKIIKYHRKRVNESISSIYPIIGPVNLDDYDEEVSNNYNFNDFEGGTANERGGVKMLNTKGEMKYRDPNL